MKIILSLAFLLSIIKTIQPCGTSTHISIAHEAATFYQGPLDAKVDYASLIQKHQDAFVAGNPYPDAMYPSVCFGGKYHEVAEDTHWAPFLNATVNYIRRKYPQPWDEATEKLVVFTFGYISHQVADISWHSLAGFKQGFIQAMANVNFHGVFDKAHTDADVGGDMSTQFDHSDDIIGSNTWYVPVDDLYEIYKEYYGGNQTVPKTVIELCSQLLYIEYIAESFAGAKIFKPFVNKSPFLLNQLDNYFLGGIHDMAAWTSKIWNETVFMLEHGTSTCNMERSTMHVNCTGYLPDHNGQSDMNRKNPGRGYPPKNGGWSYNDVQKTKGLRGVYFTPGDKMEKYISEVMEKRKKALGPMETSEHSYSQIGKSMEEIKTPDDTYLVIGAPTYSDPGRPSIGKVWFIPTSKFDSDNEQEEYPSLDAMATRIVKGSKEMGRFGWSIKHNLFRKDPTDTYLDLMISAPTTGGDSLTYKGEVKVYYGTKKGLSLTPDTSLTIDPPPKQPLKHAHTNYGYSLEGTRYITVNSPFYDNQSGISFDPITFQTVGQSNQEYSWYGYSRSVQFVNVPQSYLSWYVETVGAPNYRICKYKNCTYDEGDLQAGGQLSVFQDGKLIHQWTGASHFEELGYSSSVGYGGRFIAVSSPGADVKSSEAGIPITLTQAGLVSVYYFPDKFMTKEPVLVFRMLGDRSYGRFGEIVRLEDVDGDFEDELIVGAPRRTTDVTEELYGGEEGAVFIYKLPEVGDQPVTFTTDQAFKSFIGTEHNARLGSSIHITRNNKAIRLLTAATTSSKHGFKSGLLHNFLLHKYQ